MTYFRNKNCDKFNKEVAIFSEITAYIDSYMERSRFYAGAAESGKNTLMRMKLEIDKEIMFPSDDVKVLLDDIKHMIIKRKDDFYDGFVSGPVYETIPYPESHHI